jgi:hypothetical protein
VDDFDGWLLGSAKEAAGQMKDHAGQPAAEIGRRRLGSEESAMGGGLNQRQGAGGQRMPTAIDTDVRRFEQQLGAELPDDYQALSRLP